LSFSEEETMKLALVATLAAWPLTAFAQEDALVSGRTRVRVTTGPEVRLDAFRVTKSYTRGNTVSEDERSVTLELQGRTLTLPRPEAEIVGTLESVDDSTLTLVPRNGGRPIVIPRDAIAKLERRGGSRGAAAQGAVFGGLSLSALVFAGCKGLGGCSREDRWEIGRGIAVAAGVGALVGAAIRSDKWAVVPVPAVSNGPRQQARRTPPGLALAWRF
jgi:hypothetical protein